MEIAKWILIGIYILVAVILDVYKRQEKYYGKLFVL